MVCFAKAMQYKGIFVGSNTKEIYISIWMAVKANTMLCLPSVNTGTREEMIYET